MSCYSIIKIEVLKPYATRVFDAMKKNDGPFLQDIRSPDGVYETVGGKVKDTQFCSPGDRVVIMWCWNHAPYIDDFEEWLYKDLMVPSDAYNVQLWEENHGYFMDRHADPPGFVKDPNARPEERGELEAVWVLGYEFSEDLAKVKYAEPGRDVGYIRSTFDNGMTDEEFKAYKAEKERKELLDVMREMCAEMSEIRASLETIANRICDTDDRD